MSIGKNIRHAAWFLVKSPQRKIVGCHTLLTDLKGLSRKLFLPKPQEKLWICVGAYNRSQNILHGLIPSLLKTDQAHQLALSLVDCGSDDFDYLVTEIQKRWPHTCIIKQSIQAFSRAKVFNQAIAQSQGDFIMAMDADMSVPQDLYARAQQNVRKGRAWFPICQWQKEQASDDWRWFTEGTGLFAALKSDFENAGIYKEAYTQWGKEDWDLFFAFYRKGICPARTQLNGLYHHWHKSLKPADFKKWF